MNAREYPIPARLNVFLCGLVAGLCLIILWSSGKTDSIWSLLLLSAAYAFVMNTGYALCHEAEHDMLHPNSRINDLLGSMVTLFFPGSFQLRRQGHLGHHLRNRTDDEAFDYYFEGESPLWKHLQYYGILTGFFWLAIFLSNIPALLNPRWLLSKLAAFDRPTEALQESLNPKYFSRIRLEALAVFALHGAIILLFQIPFWKYFVVLCGFGFLWSTLQYIHHYGTERDIQRGALNVRTWRVFDLIWLNHHWHLNHHLHPNIPWIHLPRLNTGEPSTGFWRAYLRQWRGPRFTEERVRNPSAGRMVR